MFTIEQINEAHSRVKSGADFPAYIHEMKSLGVKQYDAYVIDGHVDYFGKENISLTSPSKYEPMAIADYPKTEDFKLELKAHQLGKTDYNTFIKMCAEKGIEKWKMNIENMTCSYFDKSGNMVLVEQVPQ